MQQGLFGFEHVHRRHILNPLSDFVVRQVPIGPTTAPRRAMNERGVDDMPAGVGCARQSVAITNPGMRSEVEPSS
jgi:hypothetical protein